MKILSASEAKANLSKYLNSLNNKTESVYIITKYGKPIARLTAYLEEDDKRLGIASGILPMLDDLNEFNNFDLESDFTGNSVLL